ncbi:hypothetical protein LUD75_10165 [Epilithonimonas sp. JDS]|uniref:hypothetical protein n=1 Tax=Epilithonimonas sp. JDS TaxID=2902797 RepID=UPI001E2DDDEB|nr:hypothetical protein [Epilithonimonas sp. JDS]MCD9855073.1 hypothetical protein [Epilithonimonas sp. JDS]
MELLYTIRGKYDKDNYDHFSWDKYKDWSRMHHLDELVSLDGMLNELLVESDYDNEDDWNHIHTFVNYQTGFFTDLEYVFKRLIRLENYNLLAVVVEPKEKCESINLIDYEFIGYDLLDQDFAISALTNCGGFDETFLPSELNKKGLIDNYEKAFYIKEQLLINNPDEHHADTNVIAVWRHKTLSK